MTQEKSIVDEKVVWEIFIFQSGSKSLNQFRLSCSSHHQPYHEILPVFFHPLAKDRRTFISFRVSIKISQAVYCASDSSQTRWNYKPKLIHGRCCMAMIMQICTHDSRKNLATSLLMFNEGEREKYTKHWQIILTWFWNWRMIVCSNCLLAHATLQITKYQVSLNLSPPNAVYMRQ